MIGSPKSTVPSDDIMFLPNLATANQREHLYFGAAKNAGVDGHYGQAGSVYQLTFGNAYLVHSHGCELVVGTVSTGPVSAASWTIDFKRQWSSSDYHDTAAAFLTTAWFRLDFDNRKLTAGCDNWQIDFDEFRLDKSTNAGSSWTNLVTDGAQSFSGTAYDPRDNRTFTTCSSDLSLGVTPSTPNCVAVVLMTGQYDREVSTSVEVGWGYGASYATYDLLTITSPPTTPTTGCTACIPSDPTCTGISSAAVTMGASSHELYAVVDNGLVVLNCTDPPSLSKNYEKYSWTLTRKQQQIEIGLHAKVGPMRSHRYVVSGYCSAGSPSTTTYNYTDSETVCGPSLFTFRHEETGCCLKSLPPFNPVCIDGPTLCDVNTFCEESITKTFSWPTMPPCPPTGSCGAWQLQTTDGRRHVAYISSGNVEFWRSNFALDVPVVSVEVAATGDAVCARFARSVKDWRLWMLIERLESGAHNLYQTVSDDDGSTWSTPSLFMANATIGTPCTTTHGEIFLTWFEWNSGTSGSGKAKAKYCGSGNGFTFGSTFTFKDSTNTDISVADGGMSPVQQSFMFGDAMVWTPIISGDTIPSTWYSLDNCKTWTRV